MDAIKVDGICKSYSEKKGMVRALDSVSFSVEKGSIFGLIGPDGAGKTSLFRILTTVMLADKGIAMVAGMDVVKDLKQIRSCIGYMPGKFSLYPDLSVEENLEFFAAIFGSSIRENYGMIRQIYDQLEPFKARRASQLSGGMKQKLALCCALIHRPKVLFLDEPTTGVDAVSRTEFWTMLSALKQQGISILISTAYMDEASLCDHIALIEKGRILSCNSPENIISAFGEELWAVRAQDMYGLLKALSAAKGIISCLPFGLYHHVKTARGSKGKETIEAIIRAGGFKDATLQPLKASIEDCFLALITNT